MAEISEAMAAAIKTAVQMEQDGRDYYLRAAEITANPQGKAMFERLAQDEVHHLETFQKMFDAIADPATWRALVETVKDYQRVPVFQGEPRVKSQTDRREDDVKALEKALADERKAIEFYGKTAADSDDPSARDIFDRIKREEEIHYALIQGEIDSITNFGYWFDHAEFRLENA